MIEQALDRLAVRFSREQTRQGLLARAELGRPAPEDAELAGWLVCRAGDELRADGSVGAALPTIWLAHELLDLDAAAEQVPTRRVLQWVLGRQGGPGAYGEGCDRERHGRRVCHHFVAGFFAAASPVERLAPITLPNGKAFRAEPAARFAVSCLALRAVLRAGLGNRPPVRRHVESLAALAEQWSGWGGYFAPDFVLAGMQALIAAGNERKEVVGRLTRMVVSSQAADGAWPGADLFHVLEALCAAGTPEAREAVRRAVPPLVARQRSDGTFGPTARQERALIAVRALRWAAAGS